MEKVLAELSVDSQEIYIRLIKMIQGETITYGELSRIIGRDIQRYRNSLYTALRLALRNDRMVFVTILRKGIRRLYNDEIPIIIGSDALSKIRRVSRRSAKKIIATDYDTLTNEMKIKHNASLSVLGAFAQMTKPTAIKRIEDAVKTNDLNKIAYANALEHFKSA